jgi:hypothetical protein
MLNSRKPTPMPTLNTPGMTISNPDILTNIETGCAAVVRLISGLKGLVGQLYTKGWYA